MGFFDRYKNIIDFILKALLVAFGTTLVVWFFALLGVLNTNPVTVTALGTGAAQQVPFGFQQYILYLFIPVFVVAILFSLLGEAKLSNSMKNHLLHTLLGSIAVAFLLTLIIYAATIGFFTTILGFVVSFWLSFAVLFGIYYMVQEHPEGAGDGYG